MKLISHMLNRHTEYFYSYINITDPPVKYHTKLWFRLAAIKIWCLLHISQKDTIARYLQQAQDKQFGLQTYSSR